MLGSDQKNMALPTMAKLQQLQDHANSFLDRTWIETCEQWNKSGAKIDIAAYEKE
jgi:hypothetical protein